MQVQSMNPDDKPTVEPAQLEGSPSWCSMLGTIPMRWAMPLPPVLGAFVDEDGAKHFEMRLFLERRCKQKPVVANLSV
jgi:hypothetical protein